jgi:ATPase subunit of ABC transporter with duplicated ATPase domains
VLGPNGSGKSSLLRIIAGVDKEYMGDVTMAKGYTVGRLEQEPQLAKGKTVREAVEEGKRDVVALLHEYEAVSHKLGDCMPEERDKLLARQSALQEKIEAANGWEWEHQLGIAMDALRCPPPDTTVDVLSGGERRRVALCRLLIQEPDILLLDEPTNDLDVNTLRALEEALQRFAGCAVVSSHDRWFLDHVATHILAFEGDSKVVWYEGNYSEYEADRRRRLGNEADRPHRSRYRKLTRG